MRRRLWHPFKLQTNVRIRILLDEGIHAYELARLVLGLGKLRSRDEKLRDCESKLCSIIIHGFYQMPALWKILNLVTVQPL